MFKRYKQAATHRTAMPSINNLSAKAVTRRNVILYLLSLAVIVLAVYYLPDYLPLEGVTAYHSSLLLNFMGVPADASIINGHAFIGNIYIARDCTGIQVIAVFLGLILPLPGAPWKNKLLSLALVSGILYAANLARIALEFWLVYFGILPWSLAHYPLSLLLGIGGVAMLVLITDQLLPEFGAFLLGASNLLGTLGVKKKAVS
ncbi:MAG: archaeosortase/exosortase family protein [Candidatus Methanomethylicus sp.]|nr:archaeosortase/exosortase family protein [Candidatus Methanomethylicus sp.]